MNSDKLQARLRQDYPRHNCISTFEAAIPAYSIQMFFAVMQKQDLTTFQRYILELLSLGVNAPDGLGHYLGVDKGVLTSSIAGLLKLRFVEQRDLQPGTDDRYLALTATGQEAVKQGPPPVPVRVTGRFLFNALTEGMISPGEEVKYPDQVQGLFVLPPNAVGKPKLSKFVEKETDVKEILKDEPAFKDATITHFLKLKEAAASFFAPVTVVVLEQSETHERTVAVYRNAIQQRPETVQLQLLLDSKKFAIPVMGTPSQLQKREIRIPTQTLPVDTVQEINNLLENEQRREEYSIQVEEHEIQKSATQDARERRELEEKLQALQWEMQASGKIIQQLQKQLRQSQIEFLRTEEEHREKLLQATNAAQERLIILSSWINLEACDEELCGCFAAALARGVHLGYFLEKDRNRRNTAYYQRNVKEVNYAIKRHLNRQKSGQDIDLRNIIVQARGTHQNILVCDTRFGITGTLRWLSSRGEGKRTEFSVLFRQREQVNELAEIALQAWNASR
jgi:hypothetical protein